MKVCGRCGVEKSLDDFQWKNKEKGWKQPWCRDCALEYKRQHYLDNKEVYKTKAKKYDKEYKVELRLFLIEYFRTHPCVDCGQSNPLVLEFDHRDRKTKVSSISRLISNKVSLARVMREIEKCDVRCANCHRIRTAEQFEWPFLAALL